MTNETTKPSFDINRPGLLTHYSYFFSLGAKLKEGLAISGNYHEGKFHPNTSLSIIDENHNFNGGLSWEMENPYPYIFLLSLPKGGTIELPDGRKMSERELLDSKKGQDVREIYTRMPDIPSSWVNAIVIPYEKYLARRNRYIGGSEKDNGYSEESTRGEGCHVSFRGIEESVIKHCLRGERIPGNLFAGGSQTFNDIDKELIRALNGGQYPYVQDASLPTHKQKARPLNKQEILENIVRIMETTPGITREMRKPVYDRFGNILYSP
jgi:hypothetical protein